MADTTPNKPTGFDESPDQMPANDGAIVAENLPDDVFFSMLMSHSPSKK
jgi:hypothetical protein